MADPFPGWVPAPDPMVVRIEFRESGQVAIHCRDGMSAENLAELLEQAAAQFRSGDMHRVL